MSRAKPTAALEKPTSPRKFFFLGLEYIKAIDKLADSAAAGSDISDI